MCNYLYWCTLCMLVDISHTNHPLKRIPVSIHCNNLNNYHKICNLKKNMLYINPPLACLLYQVEIQSYISSSSLVCHNLSKLYFRNLSHNLSKRSVFNLKSSHYYTCHIFLAHSSHTRHNFKSHSLYRQLLLLMLIYLDI